ncbi:MAG: GIY-YIG nuclease family protein [Alphaproteobacteria bacterium]
MIYYVYILSNKKDGTLYIGVTGNLSRRIWEHKNSFVKGFSQKYKLKKLIFYEIFEDVYFAIQREKQLKGWTRKKKIALFKEINPLWKDMSNTL